MEFCREGDEFVVWKLDRFGRSLKELIELVGGRRDRGVEFVSLRESLDTTPPGGKLVFHVFGAGAEFGRDLILESTMAGLEAAKARGRHGSPALAATTSTEQEASQRRVLGLARRGRCPFPIPTARNTRKQTSYVCCGRCGRYFAMPVE